MARIKFVLHERSIAHKAANPSQYAEKPKKKKVWRLTGAEDPDYITVKKFGRKWQVLKSEFKQPTRQIKRVRSVAAKKSSATAEESGH